MTATKKALYESRVYHDQALYHNQHDDAASAASEVEALAEGLNLKAATLWGSLDDLKAALEL